jgi:hypothetical protein
MLVYANHLKFTGADAEEAIFKGIGAWLKMQLGFGLHPDQLRQGGEFSGNRGDARSWLRVYATAEEEPGLFAWILKHDDDTVRGRQWIIELGLKNYRGIIELSCVVKTDEHSTLVASPVAASCPRVIGYIANNIAQASHADFATPVSGVVVKRVGEDADSYHALLAEIERCDRDCPIVLVSPTRDGEYLLNATDLQQKLLGLGQVVEITRDFSSYEMAEVLGEQQSAWSGAVNILYTPTRYGFVRTRLFLSNDIDQWGNTQQERMSRILAWVTDNTNVLRLRNHVRPEGVMQLALRRRLQEVRARGDKMNAAQLREELERLSRSAAEQAEWISTLETDNADVQAQLSETRAKLTDEREEVGRQQYTIQTLKDQLQQAGGAHSTTDSEALLKVACRSDPPTPTECLELIGAVYADQCVVLQSARDSAREVPRFEHGRRLLDMLRRLVTDYRTTLLERGDNEARKIFGNNEYAAKESETVMGNAAMRRLRTFDYEGRRIEMFRHLKIGIEANVTKTIRVHFYCDIEGQKIVIGYCGEHLPVAAH